MRFRDGGRIVATTEGLGVSAPNDVHVVIGGAGGTGAALVAELLRRGHTVRSVSRRGTAGPVGIEAVAADVGIPSEALDATREAAVIYQAAQPGYDHWSTDFPPMQAALLAAAEAHQAKLVMADNLYMYGPVDGLMREDMPPHPLGKKGRLRAQLADELLAAHRDGRVRVAIGRSSDYFGPGGVNSTLGEFLFGAAVKNKTTRWLGSLDVPHAVSYLGDMAVGLATLGERDDADGQIWHLPTNATLTGREFLTAVWQAVGQPAKIGHVGRLTIRIGGFFSPRTRELYETLYQWESPFLVDDSKWQSTFGPYQPLALAEAIERTLMWFRSRGRPD
jgi:nucleoside-diphosphate-sugar epimerase